MWLIDCILFVIGTVAAVMGVSFYVRNKEAAGNIRFYILSYGIFSSLWCYSYGIMGLCDDFYICGMVRKAGVFAIDAFLITEVYLVTEMSGANRKMIRCARIAEIVASVADFAVYSKLGIDEFVRTPTWTSWHANPTFMAERRLHTVYIGITFIILIGFGIAWIKNNRLKRLGRFLVMVFVSNFTMLFFTLPDTFLPQFGIPAIPTSGIGAALCTIVMWYGAIELNSFDIRTGHVKDRLFDFLSVGVMIFDGKRRLALLNNFSEKLLGKVNAESFSLSDVFEMGEVQMEEMFARATDDIFAKRLWDITGKKAYSVRMKALKDNYGDIFCYMCVFVDITEEVETASKLRIASRAKSRFLAQMSHEIRTPINAVLGMNEMILRESTDEDILEYAANIDSAGNTLLSLINSILDFSKIEDGKMEIIPVRYDTASFINDVVNSVIHRADAKGLALNLSIDENLPCEMVGDDVRFSQIIMNLLTNAVKYTEKGSVTFTVKLLESSGEKAKLFVSVADTGQGIKEADVDKLYESFERLDAIKNRNIEGTGLGISIVTSLLEMMGSRLSVESTYGEGSNFSFVIEQEIADATPIGDYEKRMKESCRNKDKETMLQAPYARVLLVDDNEMNLKVAKNLLKLCGIVPDMVTSGEATIDCMHKHPYDIVFLDHMMPGLDGIETLHRLQEEQLIPANTTMIALTANAVVGARERYINEGFTDYISKPIEVRELVEKLSAYLPERAYKKEEPAEAVAEPSETSSEPGGMVFMEFAPEGEEEGDMIMEFSADEADGEASSEAGKYDLERLAAAGIDTDIGLNYCAWDEDIYFETLDEYAGASSQKAESMEALFAEGKWKDYEVMVHAAKSNSKMIGAMKVSSQALSLEQAAEREDAEYIESNHPAFIAAYLKLAEKIKAAGE